MARAATAPARAPRTAPRPAAPRRRSGGATVPTRAPARRTRRAPSIGRVLEGPAGRILDTLLMGRAWVVLIGVLLAGIVFFNVSLLSLNQGITRDSEKAQALQQQNAELRLEVANLASTERIQQLAAKKGFTMPAAGAVGYLRSDPRADARRALARMAAPEPAASTPAASTGIAAGSAAGQTSAAAPPQASATVPAATPVPAASPPGASSAGP
jgi:cell division protein FtsL